MRTIIAGGRRYRFTGTDIAALDRLREELPITEVVSGGAGLVYLRSRWGGLEEWYPHKADEPFPDFCLIERGSTRGADLCGEAWAKWREIPVRRFLPNWAAIGKAAGPRRNAAMARESDACVLFPGGAGTASMAREAALAGLRVFDWRGGVEG